MSTIYACSLTFIQLRINLASFTDAKKQLFLECVLLKWGGGSLCIRTFETFIPQYSCSAIFSKCESYHFAIILKIVKQAFTFYLVRRASNLYREQITSTFLGNSADGPKTSSFWVISIYVCNEN